MNGINLWSLLIQVIVGIIIVAPVLWLVGRSMVGKEKAKFTDSIWIVALGIIITVILGTWLQESLGWLLGLIITWIVWLALIKHFFDTGWMKALVLAIVLVIVLVIVGLILAALGIAMLFGFGAITGIFG
jgi:hypothetical protein